MPEVVLENISKMYGSVVASKDINLTIHDKEYVTILGPSGCGKTTLIRIIAGILEPSKGKVYIDGMNMGGVPIEERGIGYVFQNIALFPHMAARENVSYGPIVHDVERKEAQQISQKYLEMVRLLDRMNMFPSKLSGGEQQKVSLARALATGAKLLLLDEPLSALDARVRMDLRYELRRLAKSLGLTVLHVTHDQEEAMTVSDRIVLMRNGQIVESNTPEMLYRKPQSIFTANFIGETNLFEGVVKGGDKDSTLVYLRGGDIIVVGPSEFESGEPVVFAIRPERVHVAETGLHAAVKSVTFVGTYYRISAETDAGDAVGFDAPSTDGRVYNVGDDVHLAWSKGSGILYKRPPEGVAEAIKLE